MKLSIKSLLNTSLITSERISLDCNIKYDNIRKLTSDINLINNFSYIMQKKLYEYYKFHKETLLPMKTNLLIRKKFNIHNGDSDSIFLDFYESKNEVTGDFGRERFKTIIGKNLDEQDMPFFILNYSDNYIVYHIKDFEYLIKHLQKLKPANFT